MNENVNIELSSAEAIVFFDFLVRFNEEQNSSRFRDQSEQRVLWDLESCIEKQLNEILHQDYEQLLKDAREKIRDKK